MTKKPSQSEQIAAIIERDGVWVGRVRDGFKSSAWSKLVDTGLYVRTWDADSNINIRKA